MKTKSEITESVAAEVVAERRRQDEKWGEQNHPDFDETLMKRPGGCSPERMAEEYEIPSETRAKFLCEEAFRMKRGTFAHILIEEVAEAVGAINEKALREELVQTAAVCVKWIEAIDRRHR